MWQDKNKEHPVFENDRQRRCQRLCTDYPIIILRSSAMGPTRILSTILSFDMCSPFLSYYFLSFSCYVLSLFFMRNFCLVSHGTWLENGRHWRMPAASASASASASVHIEFRCPQKYATNLCSSQQQQLVAQLKMSGSKIQKQQATSIRWAYFMKFENLHILWTPQGTCNAFAFAVAVAVAFCAVVSSLIWLIYAILKMLRCAH